MEKYFDPRIYIAGELGIGLNSCSNCLGNCYIEDESAYGTFHVGLGRNIALGGVQNAKGHFDLVCREPETKGEKTMKVLLTGFDPFGGESVNPAFEAIKLLPDTIAGAEIVKVEIPTEFTRSISCVEAAIKEHNPDVVIDVGQAGGRACVTVEKVGINLADARIPDNAGEQPSDEPLQADGPTAYFATIPVKAMVQNVREHGLPCHVSFTAGTYVCNCVMYNVLHLCATKYPNIRAGFIHVPFACEQVVGKASTMASMPLETIAKSLEYCIEAVVTNKEEVKEAMGTTH